MNKNIFRGWIPTTGLVLAMALNTLGNGGINVSTFASGDGNSIACGENVQSGINVSTLTGMLVSDFAGMLVSDFAGINVSTLIGINVSTLGTETKNGCEMKK